MKKNGSNVGWIKRFCSSWFLPDSWLNFQRWIISWKWKQRLTSETFMFKWLEYAHYSLSISNAEVKSFRWLCLRINLIYVCVCLCVSRDLPPGRVWVQTLTTGCTVVFNVALIKAAQQQVSSSIILRPEKLHNITVLLQEVFHTSRPHLSVRENVWNSSSSLAERIKINVSF